MVQDRSDKSLCEKSMKMVVNIIKLSSFSIAKMSLGAAGHPTETKNFKLGTSSDMLTDELLQPQFSGSQKSEKLQSGSKPISVVMQPGGENESLMVQKSDSDGMFAAYIKRVHEKNRRNMHEASKHSPFILPPPPRPLITRNK